MQKRRLLPLLALALPLSAPRLSADAPPSAVQASPSADDLNKQLADTQDKLSTALRSYSLLQDENAQLKDAAEKGAADKAVLAEQLDSAKKTIAALRIEAAAATEVETLKTRLRQSQDQIAALVAENTRLKIRLSLATRPPSGGMPVPTRPAQN